MDVLITYHGMARGAPYVVPSWDTISTPPQVNNLGGLLYVLMIYMEISGQLIWMLLASTNRISSVPPSSKIWTFFLYGDLGTRTVASANLLGAGCQHDLLL